MRTGGFGLALAYVAVIAWPLAEPVILLLAHPAALAVWLEAERMLALAGSSAGLVLGTLLLAVPFGAAAALLIERCSPFGANLLRGFVALGVFLPLPVYATAWQTAFAVFGKWTAGPDPLAGVWRPWMEGLPPAIWVHAAAGLPWVAAIVAIALRTTDRKLEDEARLAGGPRAVLRWVLVPRLIGAIAAASAVVAVQAWSSITVTDTMIVRTFAEEVYTQIVGSPDGVAGAVAAVVPVWVVAAMIGAWLARRFANRAPAIGEILAPQPRPVPKALRIGVSVVLWLGIAGLAAVPLGTLIARAAGREPSITAFAEQIGRVAVAHGGVLADSLAWSFVAGFIATALAWFACVRAMHSRLWAAFLFPLAVVAWLTPGPLLGFGLKGVIDRLLTLEDAVLAAFHLSPGFPPLRSLLYDQPSPLPAMWAAVVRGFPIAVAFLWPALWQIPREVRDLGRLDGGFGWQGRTVVWPLTRGAFARTFLATAVLALGELDAGKLVQPPGRQSFVQDLFNAMHYGPDPPVATMTLLQIAATALACVLFLIPHCGRLFTRRKTAKTTLPHPPPGA